MATDIHHFPRSVQSLVRPLIVKAAYPDSLVKTCLARALKWFDVSAEQWADKVMNILGQGSSQSAAEVFFQEYGKVFMRHLHETFAMEIES